MISFKREFKILMRDPKTKQIPYVWTGSSQKEANDWYDLIKDKEKFKGLEPVSVSRSFLLMNGKPFYPQQKHFLVLVVLIQFIFIVWSLCVGG